MNPIGAPSRLPVEPRPYTPDSESGFRAGDGRKIHKHELRIPGLGFLPNKLRNHFIASVGEFIGTFLFLFFAFAATQVGNAAAQGGQTGNNNTLSQVPNSGTLIYISLAFGFSLAVNAWVFFRISGGLFNPAVTLGMFLIGALTYTRAILLFIAQILGGIAAAAVVSGLFAGPLNVTTSINGSTSVTRGLFIEMFLTAELVLTIFMLAAEKHKGTFMAPLGIGLALFVAELAGVFFTGGSLNPTRSLGPCVVTGNFPSEHWIYWVGPLMGSLLAVGFYHFIKTLEYETANPGQDFNEHEHEAFEFDEENTARGEDIVRPGVALTQNLELKPTESNPMSQRSSDQNRLSNVGGGSPPPVASSPYSTNSRSAPVQGHEPVHPANPNLRSIRMDGSESMSEKDAEVPYTRGPDAENGTMHPGYIKRD